MPRSTGVTRTHVRVVDAGVARRHTVGVATEEPLEIRVRRGAHATALAVTMRTPGADHELAVGFLLAEGIVSNARDVLAVGHCVDGDTDPEQALNVVSVDLADGVVVDLGPLARRFAVSSACGVCGKASLDQLELRGVRPVPPGPTLALETLYGLPDRLRWHQRLFDATGGLHAAGLFDTAGTLVVAREDVGRHNAVDKVLGWATLNGCLPLHDHVVLVSGRSSFEIVQKCLVAGVPMVCSVSAPSSLAVDVARRFGMTLVGFLRGRTLNVYTGVERVRLGPA